MYRRRFIKATLWSLLGLMAVSLFTGETSALNVNWRDDLKITGNAAIVPDHFLRRFDPVTIFFDGNRGPDKGGPENHPEKFVTFSPAHPGAFQWLDDHTLQFRPAEPWPPLSRYTWQVEDLEPLHLVTLMMPPTRTIPARNEKNLDSLETITLFFPDPIPPRLLAEMITIELNPLPGVEKEKSRFLDKAHFEIKLLERAGRSDPAGYVLVLREPVAGNTLVRLHLKLSLDPGIKDSLQTISFETAPPFRITRMGTSGQLVPVTAGGVLYTKEQALTLSLSNRSLEIQFSSPPDTMDPIKGRNLVRFTPAVDGLTYTQAGNQLSITGQFEKKTLYQVDLMPYSIKDSRGRPLQMDGPSRFYFYLPPQSDYLKWKAGRGIIERFGPQMIPLEGRGIERLDVRIYPIDPLDRSLWPFPEHPIVVDENEQPYAPGEEPAPFEETQRHIYAGELKQQIKALGSPVVSTLTGIPLTRDGNAATFGFDVKPLFAKITGENSPGSYLVGVRKLDGSGDRHYVRVQVTDLCLTVVEEAQQIQFIVSSLKTGQGVSRARVVLEGMYTEGNQRSWKEIVSGKTNSKGFFTWTAPGDNYWKKRYDLRRMVVVKERDVLVLDPTRPPDAYTNNVWQAGNDIWCQWALDQKSRYEHDDVNILAHIFPERPVYKPGEVVHLKGYLRTIKQGALGIYQGRGVLVVNGPGRLKWRYPVTVNKYGSFYQKFQEEKTPTGYYSVHYEDKATGDRIGAASFNIEAYRLPKFEVNLNGPDTVSLDAPFTVGVTAKYYAGGRVAQQPLRWRVTQFPYTWNPKKREGYYYSTDARFSRLSSFRATPAREKSETTDAQGSASIEIDPTRESTAQPRRYIVEATITGADDQTVSGTQAVLALPPFTLGLKIPRYIKNAQFLEPQIIVVDAKGELMAGQSLKVTVRQRQWHSHLQAGDFSKGSAQYITDVVDETICERQMISRGEALKPKIPIPRSGVYIVEIDAQDQIGRSQSIAIDLFAGGDEPVSWQQPPSSVFKVTPEKKSYQPGDTAVLLLESPFQDARVLAVIEQPDGKNQYTWLTIENGSAAFSFEIEKAYMPRVPVHFILMRGRRTDSLPLSLTALDLGKPKTLAATAWVEVEPSQNRINVELEHPAKAQPGDEIKVALKLTDDKGKPVSGEVTLWLVDQAVLALGREQARDPLGDFIVSRDSHFVARDTRNLIFGHFPLQEIPGGGMAAAKMAMSEMADALLDKVTVRKNFQPVPYYNPDILVDGSGKTVITVKLPDNLTNFKLRVKAVSGPDRFGWGQGHLALRLPVIVQPALPRFVRPGDRFTAIAIGRMVDGDEGPGRAEIRVEGLTLEGSTAQDVTWRLNEPQRITYPLTVPTPEFMSDGGLSRESVSVTLGVMRQKDGAKDAFTVQLPIQPDRRPVRRRHLEAFSAGNPLRLPAIEEAVRPGTLKRALTVARNAGIVRMAAGLSYLMAYPHGCTEQRISRARALLAAKRFREVMFRKDAPALLKQTVLQTLQWLDTVKDSRNLAAYWPGSAGNVSLTAWSVQFMIEAREAGFTIDEKLFAAFKQSLKQALRSDYAYYIDGESYAERCWALTALAAAGELDVGYATELARRVNYLNLESVAQVAHALQSVDGPPEALLKELDDKLWRGLVFRLYQGREIYGGLQAKLGGSPLILPSETRTIAEVLRAVAPAQHEKDHKKMLVEALLTLGQDDGWGSTNANSAALLALIDYLTVPDSEQNAIEMNLSVGVGSERKPQTLVLAKDEALRQIVLTEKEAIEIDTAVDREKPLMANVETVYLPQADGSREAAHAAGFVIQRELLKVSPGDAPPERFRLDEAGVRLSFKVTDIIEEHIEVVNPQDRYYVAVVIPIACGMEPLNPNLATAPPEAEPAGKLTLAPTYVALMDDAMAYYYNSLPKGTYHFYFRTRATIPGTFIQPGAYAEMMYDQSVSGRSNGAAVTIVKSDAE